MTTAYSIAEVLWRNPPASILRIGTRGSPLALAQARMVRDALAAAHGLDAEQIAIEVIRTTGDRIQDRPLAEVGGKGLFTKEIEEALLAARSTSRCIRPRTCRPCCRTGLVLAAFLEREDPRDAFISRKAKSLAELPRGATVGTASLRRQAMVKRLRPDLEVVPLRGNVETRLRKLDEGVADATLLALAGLKRLGLADAATAVLSVDEFLPAVGQGAIGIETRADDARTRADAGGDRSRRHAQRARRRARLPGRARRLLPHADRRPRDDCRRRRSASAA